MRKDEPFRFQKVVVTTDLSELAAGAIPYAYSVTAPGGCVWILHIETPLEFGSSIHGHHASASLRLSEEQSIRKSQCHEQMRRLIPPWAEEAGIRSEVAIIASSDAALAIHRAVQEYGADLLCLASRGRSGLVSALLGSVSQKVIASSTVPVLVVPSGAA